MPSAIDARLDNLAMSPDANNDPNTVAKERPRLFENIATSFYPAVICFGLALTGVRCGVILWGVGYLAGLW
jgi:hypothetical protein